MNVFVLILVLMIAVYFDFRFRKIPNKVTFPAITFGIIYWLFSSNLVGFSFSIGGVLVGFLVFIVPYIAGGMGAGDVKLMMAVGALLGWKFTVLSALLTAVAGGIIALGYIIFNNGGKDARANLFQLLVIPICKIIYRITCIKWFLSIQSKHKVSNDVKSKKYIPYAIPIAIGTLLAVSGLFNGIINF